LSNILAVSQSSVQDVLSVAIRAYAGHGRQYSTALLADAAVISESSVKQYAQGVGTPGLVAFLRLVMILGPEFGNAITRLAGFEMVPTETDAVNSYALNAHAAELLGKIADAIADDGRIDHMEEAEMAPLVERLHSASGAWLARRVG